ncbi:chaperone protein dnaJ 1, mitochondrial isoform X2 [Panicum hallii]|uniref:chaperone protein dnaJ 1, mitochondrial isoform X2 n=1 Tax=Panicum hallii TaxID=206008 RepID=UPI000DF4CE95|nr:chaperone protein dnaJ 1, mitochondrial isoform X2 [Panicum hallii]
MGRFGWLRHASRSLALRLGEVAAQRSTWVRQNAPCSSTGMYIGDKYNGRFMLLSFISSRSFHATGHCCSIDKDYYKILGVPKDASQDDIKKAFHSLAKKYHPDTNRGNAATKRMFQEIRDAYETLRDPSKREQYDMLFSRGSRGKFDGSYHDTFSGSNNQNHDPFTEFHRQNDGHFSSRFYKIFSEVFQQATNMHANDIKVELNLSFSEAAKGCIKQVSFSAKNVCDSCGGRGHLANAKKYVCPSCKGLGRVSTCCYFQSFRADMYGSYVLGLYCWFMQITSYPFTTTCGFCRGAGKVIMDHCLTCEGSGVVDGMKNVEVKLPAGIDSGDTIHVRDAGDSGGLGTQHGSLYIKIQVANDPVFRRDGADIHVNKKISFTQAMLGGMVEIPTLNGTTEVKIPKGVQPGHVLVLRGKGLPNLSGYFGDQYVQFQIHFPSVVSERQRALLEEFILEEATKEQNTSIVGNWLYQQLSTG